MKTIACSALALLAATAALAFPRSAEVRAALHAALEEQADFPLERPRYPDAREGARRHSDDALRDASATAANEHGKEASEAAHAEAAARAAQGSAASAAKAANGEARSAAAQDRSNGAHGGPATGGGGHGPPPHPGHH